MNQPPIDLAQYKKSRKAKPARSDAVVHSCGPGEVPCVRCKQPIAARAKRCPHCKIHFTGLAEDFAPAKPLHWAYKVGGIFLVVAIVLVTVFDF